ncbi:MAG: hypothetical protein IKI63_03115, partial [Clostridia bacterium]|nr:hypothetical protein [Clostridia bacterium]
TDDLLITSELLYQLSHSSIRNKVNYSKFPVLRQGFFGKKKNIPFAGREAAGSLLRRRGHLWYTDIRKDG